MATELAMSMRRLKAQEAQAKEIAELNRKMDLVMTHLGIGTTAAPDDEAPAAGGEKAETDEVPAGDGDKAETDEVPAGDGDKAETDEVPAGDGDKAEADKVPADGEDANSTNQ